MFYLQSWSQYLFRCGGKSWGQKAAALKVKSWLNMKKSCSGFIISTYSTLCKHWRPRVTGGYGGTFPKDFKTWVGFLGCPCWCFEFILVLYPLAVPPGKKPKEIAPSPLEKLLLAPISANKQKLWPRQPNIAIAAQACCWNESKHCDWCHSQYPWKIFVRENSSGGLYRC